MYHIKESEHFQRILVRRVMGFARRCKIREREAENERPSDQNNYLNSLYLFLVFKLLIQYSSQCKFIYFRLGFCYFSKIIFYIHFKQTKFPKKDFIVFSKLFSHAISLSHDDKYNLFSTSAIIVLLISTSLCGPTFLMSLELIWHIILFLSPPPPPPHLRVKICFLSFAVCWMSVSTKLSYGFV